MLLSSGDIAKMLSGGLWRNWGPWGGVCPEFFLLPSGPLSAPFKLSTLPFKDFDNHGLLKAHTWASVPGRKNSSDLINLNKNTTEGRKLCPEVCMEPNSARGAGPGSSVPSPGR